jgi:hypothetical protein
MDDFSFGVTRAPPALAFTEIFALMRVAPDSMGDFSFGITRAAPALAFTEIFALMRVAPA